MANRSDFSKTDWGSIVSQLEDQEERIRLKRRWLLGLDLSESECEKAEFLKSQFLPESLLREDDIFYGTITSRVEEAFGLRKREQVCNVVQEKLDSLTNKGLYLIATIVTLGSTSSFEKTRSEMKQIVREWINREKIDDGIVIKKLHKVVSDPRNFRKDCTAFDSHRDAAVKILNDELDDLPTQTLLAMKRKLKGLRKVPRLKTTRFNESRSNLVQQVRQASEEFLSLSQGSEAVHEQLAKALALVNLSGRLIHGYKPTTAIDFFDFSTETKDLHNEIVKALWLLEEVKFEELKKLHLLLDPEAKISNKRLRSAVKKMLIDYLYECSDMDTIPKSLLEALSIVNTNSRNVDHKVFPKEAIEEERECILNVSAQVKETFWECIPDYEIDQDFADAYWEEPKDSDDDDDDDDDVVVVVHSSDHEEGGAECSFMESTDQSYFSSQVVIRDSSHPRPLDKPTLVSKMELDSKPCTSKKNQYLALEEIADETSLVAYDLIGRLLEKFADQKALPLDADARSYLGAQRVSEDKQASSVDKSDESIVLSVAKELIPSLDDSALMKLQELMEVRQTEVETKTGDDE